MLSENTSRSGSAHRQVLVVEDDELMQAFYKALFRRHKDEFICRFEKSAEAALEQLRGGDVEAAVLDWDLPGISGLDLLKALRSDPKTRSIRIMVVSGRTQSEDQVRALESGADDYLSKPFQVEIFLARLRSLLRR